MNIINKENNVIKLTTIIKLFKEASMSRKARNELQTLLVDCDRNTIEKAEKYLGVNFKIDNQKSLNWTNRPEGGIGFFKYKS